MTVFDGVFDRDSLLVALDILIKLGLGALLSGAIGIERELHGRPAGVRTHMLVVIGVILFSECSRLFGGDPARIAAQIVTGIGFLGAGTIMRMGPEIKGLTTAASIWAAAGIGMAISAGGALLLVAFAATVLVLLTLAVVDDLERRINPSAKLAFLRVALVSKASLGKTVDAVLASGAQLRHMRFSDDESGLHVSFGMKGIREDLVAVVASVDGVTAASWE